LLLFIDVMSDYKYQLSTSSVVQIE